MGLRSAALLDVLAVVAAALAAGVFWFWPALARRGAGALLLRAGALVALQASVLALVFVWVNRSQEFYASWSDLLGTTPIRGRVVAVGAGTRAAPGPRGQAAAGRVPWARQGNSAPRTGRTGRAAAPPLVAVLSTRAVAVPGAPRGARGRLQAVEFAGPVSGIRVRGYVYSPPSAPGPAAAPLPVIVVVSGRPAAGVYGAPETAATAAKAMAAHRLPPAVVVTLPAAVDGPASQGCLDVPAGPQAAEFFTQDLVRALASGYHATTAPSDWAVIGGAGGGYCALQLATDPAGQFGLAVVRPGTYSAPGGYRAGSPLAAIGASTSLKTQDNLLWRIRNLPAPPVQVLVAGPGRAGKLLAAARPPMRVSVARLGPPPLSLTPVFAWVGRAMGGRT